MTSIRHARRGPAGSMCRRELIRLVAGAAYGAARSGEWAKLPPVDEASRDSGLVTLLAKVRILKAQRDFRGLEALMLPTFRVEFDVGKGPAAFRRKWHPESASSALWQVLERLFSLGGTFYSDTLFGLPYVYTRFPADLDPLGHVVVVQPATRLLDGPGRDARLMSTIDNAVLPLANRLRPPVLMSAEGYLEVKAPGIGWCFVRESDVYSPAAHRAYFEKRAGQWRWISLACATLAEPPDLKGHK